MVKRWRILILLFFIGHTVFAGKVDSLKQVLKNKNLSPAQQLKVFKDLSFNYCFVDADSGMYYVRQMYRLADKHQDLTFKAKADAMLATNYYIQLNYDSAIVYFEKAILYAEKTKDNEILGSAYNNLGLVHLDRSQHAQALKYMFKALESRKKDKKLTAEVYDNIGLVYQNISDYSKALEYQFKALKLMEELGDKKLISDCYNNIAIAFDHNKQHQKALAFYFKSLHLITDTADHHGLATCYANIAITYNMLHMSSAALKYTRMSMKHFNATRDLWSIYGAYNNLGLVYMGANDTLRKTLHMTREMALDSALYYFDQRVHAPAADYSFRSQANLYLNISEAYRLKEQYALSKKHALIALELARKSESKEAVVKVLDMLASVCNRLHQDAEAYVYLKEYIKTRDEVFSIEKNNEITSRALNYQFEKKQLADSLLRQKERHVARERINQQGTIIREKEFRMYLLYAIIALVLIFSFFLYNRIKLINKQKNTIQEQKQLVEEKQKEILDSINYAQRLQYAILAEPEEIKRHFPESFLVYQPKDIVAGDFYFFEITGTHIFLAAADCTGHGVPGAMVSVVCANALTRCVKEFGLTEPGLILDKTRTLVLDTFKKSGQEVKDGMDISLISLRFEDLKNSKDLSGNGDGQMIKRSNLRISWAGANNPLWYIENGTMKELTADKQPIGYTDHAKPFTTHQLSLSKGTQVFLFTDGYADQFGGVKGKKFKYANLQQLLQKNMDLRMVDQGHLLQEQFAAWKGDLEQVDDVCIIGIKL